jgi:hypothetical protein
VISDRIERVVGHLRGNVVAYLALLFAVAGGGGYALAATAGSGTISACAAKMSGELFLRTRGRCMRGQTSVSWNRQGQQGVPGKTGPAGATPPSAWAIVSNAGQAEPSDGISAQRLSAGTYQITVTAPACAGKENAPTVTVSDRDPPNGQPAGAFPVAWVAVTGSGSSFTVYSGVVVNGTFTPTDHTFDVQDVCG